MMKILKLKVTKLYGVFNYDVEFNSDVTFIYGENGCGKTTILNITEAIITGQLYNLFDYKFNEIILYYSHNGKKTDIKEIKISMKKNSLNVTFNEKDYKITVGDSDDNNLINSYYFNKFNKEMTPELDDNFDEMESIYFNRYSFLNKIKNTFNYVYLPLNRSSIYDNRSSIYDFPRSIRANMSGYTEPNRVKVEKGIRQVEELVASKCLRINGTIATINDEFRNNILKSLMEVSSENSFVNNVVNFKNDKNLQNEMNDIKKEYIKTLLELGLLADNEENSMNEFFDNFIKDLYLYKYSNEVPVDLSLLSQYQEIIKIKKIINIAKESEKQKSDARSPIETFLTTINGFIESGADNKKIAISKEGKIYFTTKYSKENISIRYLSSGEKQLIIFFANLIFNVKSGKSGIFVVDEPEISLHLSWQREFVEKALEVNNNLQLIFATHAPEIIGKRRNKAFRLEKIFEEAGSPN